MPRPAQHARETVDRLLKQAGWEVCDPDQVNIHVYRGIAVREFPLRKGHGAPVLLSVVRPQARSFEV